MNHSSFMGGQLSCLTPILECVMGDNNENHLIIISGFFSLKTNYVNVSLQYTIAMLSTFLGVQVVCY